MDVEEIISEREDRLSMSPGTPDTEKGGVEGAEEAGRKLRKEMS